MREYRDADILIIDDVQNIVGKQASVEFFFQLVDSFIREGKKSPGIRPRAQGPCHGRAPHQPLQQRHALPGVRAGL